MKKKIKMIVVCTSFEHCGGVERFLLNFLNIFPEERYQIDLLLFDDKQDDAKMFDMVPENIRILSFLKQFSRWSTELIQELRDTHGNYVADVRNFIHLRNTDPNFTKLAISERHEKNWEILSTICPYYDGYDVAVAFRNTLPLKVVAENVTAEKKYVFIHTDIKTASDAENGQVVSLLTAENPYLKKMNGIICVTKQNAEKFSNVFPTLSDKVNILVNVCDHETMIHKSKEFYPPEYAKDTYNILTVARIEKGKGIELLIDAARILKDSDINFRWIVLGKNHVNQFYERYLELLKMSNIEDCVIHVAEQPNIFPYYLNCDLYVHTSFFEGRSLAIEEAMVLNCPIVTTNFPSVYDQIKDGMNGRICEMSAKSMAETILILLKDETERYRISRANVDYLGNEGKINYFEYFS